MRSSLLLPSLLALAACSSGTAAPDASPPLDGGSLDRDAGSLDATRSPDASPADAAASDAAQADAAAPPDGGAHPSDAAANVGFVTLSSDRAPPQARALVTFLRGGPAYTCAEQAFGACVFYRCSPRPGAGMRPAPSAGPVHVTGGAQPLAFTPSADGTYPDIVLHTALWTGGETLTASAAGALVPAFRGQLSTPRPITLTAPPVPNGDWMLDQTQDVAVTWTGGTVEDVKLTFGSNLSADPLELECTFRGSDHAGTVPAAGLAALPAGAGYYSAATRLSRDLDLPEWRITLRADTDALLPDGRVAIGGAVFR